MNEIDRRLGEINWDKHRNGDMDCCHCVINAPQRCDNWGCPGVVHHESISCASEYMNYLVSKCDICGDLMISNWLERVK